MDAWFRNARDVESPVSHPGPRGLGARAVRVRGRDLVLLLVRRVERRAGVERAEADALADDDAAALRRGVLERRERLRADLGGTRVIRRRFNVSVPRARVPEQAPRLRGRSER